MDTSDTPIEGFASQDLPDEPAKTDESVGVTEPVESNETAAPDQSVEPFETSSTTDDLRVGRDGAEQKSDESKALDPTSERLAGIEAALLAYNDRVATLEQLNAKMHSLVEANREATVIKLLQPMFAQLATLYTDLLKAADFAEAEGEAQNYREFAERLEYLVSLYDLEVIPAEPGQLFNATLHASAMVKKTQVEEQDKTVVRAVRHGLKVVGAERPLIPTQVVVYRYQAPAQPDDNA